MRPHAPTNQSSLSGLLFLCRWSARAFRSDIFGFGAWGSIIGWTGVPSAASGHAGRAPSHPSPVTCGSWGVGMVSCRRAIFRPHGNQLLPSPPIVAAVICSLNTLRRTRKLLFLVTHYHVIVNIKTTQKVDVNQFLSCS